MSSPLSIAERALAAAGCPEAVATVTRERSTFLRFARSQPTQATSVEDATVEIAVAHEGHVGRARTNAIDDEALSACAVAALAGATAALGAAGAPGGFPGFPPSSPGRAHAGHDALTARLDSAVGGEALAAAFSECAAQGVEAHGLWTAAEVETAIASAGGVAASDRVTDAFMKVTGIAPGGRSGYASAAGVSVSDLDACEIARTAASKAAVRGEPERLAPGTYPVVLEPQAVGELLGWLGALAFNGLAYAEGRSALAGRLGTRVAAARINLADSPRFGRTLPRAFDAEGVAKAPLPLIQDGIAHRVVHDTRSASIAGGQTTGHALVAGGDDDGPLPTNLVLSGGGCADEDELCVPIERGIYVTRLWYTNAVRPKETLITGMTRDGTFLIEDGRVTRPLLDMRFTDSVLDLLDRCEELSARPVLTSEGEFYGRRHAFGAVCPALRTSMRFTG
ncbi:MAG: hypothetical protein NVS2B6_06630 [Thermoleophilaceae bacterium]